MATIWSESEYAVSVERALSDFFNRFTDDAAHIDPAYQRLWRILHDQIEAGGKRLRPMMLLMAYEAFGGAETQKVIPVAAAQELLHLCLLIHDDVIDRDYMRHGTANVAGRYKVIYADHAKTPDDLTHFAHSAAIMGGDLMLAGAHRMIIDSALNAEEKLAAQRYLSDAIFEVAGGELRDTELSFLPYSAGDALKVARYKTAGYSFVAPLLTGAKLASISDTQTEALTAYATALGIAYQIVDDILGVFGDQKQTGKPTSSDIIEGKKTYMVERALAVMTSVQKKTFEKWYGNAHTTPAGLRTVKKLLESTGAKTAAEDIAQQYADIAGSAIAGMKLDENYEQKFRQLIDDVTHRVR